jgi:hypothetical protein
MRRATQAAAVGAAVAGVLAAALGGTAMARAAGPGPRSGAAAVRPAAAPAAGNGGSIVEDYAYPGAAAILAQQNIRLITGDGHILLADCSTTVTGAVGLIKVAVSDPARDYQPVCFSVTAPEGWLTLEVPAVYSIDGRRAGTSRDVTADVRTDDGEHAVVAVDQTTVTPVGIGIDEDHDPTTLVRLSFD